MLPVHLADSRGLNAAQFREFNAERREWFLDRGINPADWQRVHAILKATWETQNMRHGAVARAADRTGA